MVSKLFLLGLFFHYLLIQRISCVCPNEDFIIPCSCKTMLFGNHVVCGAINSTEVLRGIFRILWDYEIHTLVLNSLRLGHQPLSSDIFNNLKVKKLRFEDSVFELDVGNSPFQGLENYLNALEVYNCNIARLHDVTFSHLCLLRDIAVNFDDTEDLTASWFRDGPRTVRRVQMDHNNLRTIQRHAFLGLRNLETISLADNKLQTFNRDVLPTEARKLTDIDLSYNQLQELPTDMFSNMPRLKKVVLTGNQLATLPQSTWGGIWNRLEQLLLKDNPIVCDSEISWAIRQRIPPHLNGSCKLPKELTGTRLAGLTADQLQSR